MAGPERTSPLNSRNSPLLINTALFPKQMWNGRFHFVDNSSTDVNKCDPRLGFEVVAMATVTDASRLPISLRGSAV